MSQTNPSSISKGKLARLAKATGLGQAKVLAMTPAEIKAAKLARQLVLDERSRAGQRRKWRGAGPPVPPSPGENRNKRKKRKKKVIAIQRDGEAIFTKSPEPRAPLYMEPPAGLVTANIEKDEQTGEWRHGEPLGSVLLTHKIRLDPNAGQIDFLEKQERLRRTCWNTCLAEYERRRQPLIDRLRSLPDGEKLTKEEWREWDRRLNPLLSLKSMRAYWDEVRIEKCWWADPNTLIWTSATRMLDDFDIAAQGSRGLLKSGGLRKRRLGKMRFKKRGERESFIASNTGGAGVKVDGKKLTIPKTGARYADVGPIKMREELRFRGAIRKCVIMREAGHWYASISVQVADEHPAPEGGAVKAVDLGIRTLASVTDGRKYWNPRPLRNAQRELNRLLRLAARQVGPYDPKTRKRRTPSEGWKKTQRLIKRKHEDIKHLREDHHHKVSTDIERGAVALGMETLDVQGMGRKGGFKLGHSVADAGINSVSSKLEYKFRKAGKPVLKVGKWFPSSKTCKHCHAKNDKLRLSQERWVCPNCGERLDRDLNAADVIGQEVEAGLASAGWTRSISRTDSGLTGTVPGNNRGKRETASLAGEVRTPAQGGSP